MPASRIALTSTKANVKTTPPSVILAISLITVLVDNLQLLLDFPERHVDIPLKLLDDHPVGFRERDAALGEGDTGQPRTARVGDRRDIRSAFFWNDSSSLQQNISPTEPSR